MSGHFDIYVLQSNLERGNRSNNTPKEPSIALEIVRRGFDLSRNCLPVIDSRLSVVLYPTACYITHVVDRKRNGIL